MRCQEQLEGYLREHQIPYQIQHHPVATFFDLVLPYRAGESAS